MHMQGGIGEQDYERNVPELEEKYPEATMFGILPASVFYLRHLENIELSNIHVKFNEPDSRLHLMAEDVTGLKYSGVQVDNSEKIRVYNVNSKNE